MGAKENAREGEMKMAEKLVSVIIPAYNRAATIKRAVDSVLCQTYPDIEVIVVDDGSTDNTAEIVNEYDDNRVQLIRQKEHGGASKARNTGIASAKGEYIAFQDSDDEWFPDKLRCQIELMECEKFQACYCAHNLIEKGKETITIPPGYQDTDKYQIHLREVLRRINAIGTPTLVITQGLLEQLGTQCFDEELPRMQDYDLVIRIIKMTEIGYVNKVLVNLYRVEECITKDRSAFYEAAARMICKHGDFLDIGQFTEYDIMADPPEVLIQGLDKMQKSVSGQDIDFKGLMITRMSEQIEYQLTLIDFQQSLLLRQNKFMIDRLEDRKFSIYGAGNIGQELYRKLKEKGVSPASFLVTKSENRGFIDDIPVIPIDEYTNRDDMVVVGIAKENQIELIDNLIERNYKQFCVYRR